MSYTFSKPQGGYYSNAFSPQRGHASLYRNYERGVRGSHMQNAGGRPVKKHSGAKSGQDKNGQRYVNGWNYSRRNGLRSFFCAPYKGTKKHTSQSGRVWENWMVKMRLANGTEEIMSGLFDTMTGRVIVKQIGFVLNPKARNGGYCGTFSNRG